MDNTFCIMLRKLVTLCFVMCVNVNSQRLACYPSEGLPKACNCNTDISRPQITCRNKQLTSVVSGIPSNTVVLDLSFNLIAKIEKDDFIGLEKLETLFLMNNRVTVIHPEAFRNLYNLRLLVLDKNKLTTIPDRLFQHLPNLTTINLQNNNIQTISRHAFITLPLSERVTIQLNDNPLKCNCELKALKVWMEANPKKLFLNSALCSDTKSRLPILSTPYSEFPNCPSLGEVIPSNATCYTCHDVINHQQCREQGRLTNCNGNQKVCSSRITKTDGRFTINKGCMWYQSCLNQERSNVRNCGLYNKPDLQCNFCCVGDECNAGDMGGRTKEFVFTLEMMLDREYNRDLENKSSVYYNLTQKNIRDALKVAFQYIDGGQTSEITGFSPPRTTISANIYSTNLNMHSTQSVKAMFTKYLTAAATNGALSELGVIKSSVVINIYTGVYCHADSLSTPQGVFVWPKTTAGRFAVVPCSNRESQTAIRNCSLTTSGKAIWLAPEMQSCLINSTIGNELKNLLDTPITKDNVRNVLNSLKTLTSGTGGLNKVQLSLAVGVLEKILTEDSSFSDMAIMNDTVAVVSQLLVTKDDVLVEAEDEFQTSTKILKNVDIIGNRVSLMNGNVKIVQPNLVLAALPVIGGNFSGVTVTTKSRANDGSLADVQITEDEDDDELDNTNDDDYGDDAYSDTGTTGKYPSKENDPDNNNNNDDIDDHDDDSKTSQSNNKKESKEIDSRNKRDKDDQDGKEDKVHSFSLPNSLFSRLGEEEKSGLERITFHVFPSGRLFSSIKGSNNIAMPSNRQNKRFITKINSGVISASVPNVHIKNLSDPVKISFSHLYKNASNGRCVFWDDGVISGIEGWSSEGCRVLVNVQGSHTTCACDHLTNFALLMDVYQQGHGISKTDQKILSIISYIGCSISFICLVLTLLTYILFKKLRKDNPSKILVNLCIALAVADFIFIIGMHSYAMDNDIGCKTVAALLHYFLLAALSWMAVEAFYMYLALVLVFKTYYYKFMLKCCIVGWGIPFVIVVITLGINNTNNYARLDSGICWLVPEAFYGAFAAPVLLVLLINFVAFALVIRQLCDLQAKKLSKSDRSDKISKVRGAIGVVILLGLTWIFAIFAIGPVQTLFSYLFAIFNALQGMFIFVFYCLFKKDALNSWRRMLPCCEVTDEKSSSRGYSGTTPASPSGNKTLSTNGISTKKRVSSKYEISSDSNGGFDSNGFNNYNTPSSTYI